MMINLCTQRIKISKFWGLMHGGISKFCTEYNGILLQSYDDETFQPLLPFRLMKMNRGVNDHLGNRKFRKSTNVYPKQKTLSYGQQCAMIDQNFVEHDKLSQTFSNIKFAWASFS